MHFLFIFPVVSDMHFVFTVDSTLAFDLELEIMDSLLEFHLVLKKFLNLFETVADDDFKLFFLDCQNLGFP